jgi:hypothetical protein
MARRGRHDGGTLWAAITILITVMALAAPQRAHADMVPVDPSALAQAGLAQAQHVVDLVAAAASAARPPAVVPVVTHAASAAVGTASAPVAASPPAAASQPAARSAAAITGATSRVMRPPAPPVHSARVADPPLPVAASAARAGAQPVPPALAAEPGGAPLVVPVRIDPVAPVPTAPVATVPMPSMPVVRAPALGAVPTVQMPDISIPWPQAWESGAVPVPLRVSVPVPVLAPAPVLAALGSMGWSLGPMRPAAPIPARRRAAQAPRTPRVRSGNRSSDAAPLATWTAEAVRTAVPAHAPVRLSPRPFRHGATALRPARPGPEPAGAAPALSSPTTGGGPAAAAAGGGGGAAATVLLVSSALLLTFLLSTRMSPELSAWRSTLLSLRLERPG